MEGKYVNKGRGRLKIKDELRHRKGPTSGGCSTCNHCVHDFELHGCDGKPRGIKELRCKIIGVENSVRYRIQPDNICDRFDNSRYMKRLRGY